MNNLEQSISDQEKKQETARKTTLVTRIMQITMIIVLAIGWLLVRFAHVNPTTVLIGFFIFFAISLSVSALIKRHIKHRK